MQDISRQIAEYVTQVRFEDLGPAAVDNAKRATLDTIGAMLAGSGVAGVAEVIDMAKGWGGKAEARVLTFGGSLPAPLAAWCNGIMARVLEIDDCVDFLPIHPSASAVPALLAVAEMQGGLSGRDFITALAVGQDLIVRLGLGTKVNAMESGRYNLFKVFGPTAAVARAMALPVDQTHNALGIAYAFAAGEGQSALDGAFSLPLQQGNTAQAAIVSALLARQGRTGAKDYLFGRMGFFNAFEPDPKIEPMLDRLGRYFHGEQLSVKPFSACRCCHPALQLTLQYRDRFGADAPLKAIKATVNPGVHALVGAHIDDMADPRSPTAAQFSMPFAVAAALRRGDFFLKELDHAVIADAGIRELARRVEVVPDAAMNTDFVLGRIAMEFEHQDGTVHSFETALPLGNPTNPLSFEACADKVRKCADYAARKPDPGALEALIDAAMTLEAAGDVSSLTERLC